MSELIDSINRMRSPKKLLQAFEAIKGRMSHLGFSYNHTDPVGQYAEFLVQKYYNAERTPNGTSGCDIITHDNIRIEVKGRVARKENYLPKTYIKDSNVSGNKFDYLVYIVFDEKYNILRAYGINIETFKKQEISKYVEHENSAPKWMFHATPELLEHPEIDDLTEELSEVQ